jgi:hypothetical protein
MRSSTLLRIAAGITLFQAIGHTVGAVLIAPPPQSEEGALRAAMAAFRFTVVGVERSYLDAYLGSGWTITVLLLASAVLLWQLARLSLETPRLARPMIFVLAAAFAGMTAVGALYFVLPPTALAAGITCCLCAAGLRARGA